MTLSKHSGSQKYVDFYLVDIFFKLVDISIIL